MSSPIFDATFQAVTLSALSNALAQGLQVYKSQSLSKIDMATFLQFVIFALFVTPPNYAWQKLLELRFPTKALTAPMEEKADDDKAATKPNLEEKLSIVNTAIKFFLDQTLGASVNTLLFISVMGMFKGMSSSAILFNVQHDFWPMLLAGYKFWPLISCLNLVVVPFEYRMLVGNAAGFGWGVYISLCNL